MHVTVRKEEEFNDETTTRTIYSTKTSIPGDFGGRSTQNTHPTTATGQDMIGKGHTIVWSGCGLDLGGGLS